MTDLTITERNLKHMIETAVAALPDHHRQRRIDYCHQTGEQGARLKVAWETGSFTVHWGGEDLISGPVSALYDEELPTGELVTWGPVPDSPAALFDMGGGGHDA